VFLYYLQDPAADIGSRTYLSWKYDKAEMLVASHASYKQPPYCNTEIHNTTNLLHEFASTKKPDTRAFDLVCQEGYYLMH
jgi:hypothetical protein